MTLKLEAEVQRPFRDLVYQHTITEDLSLILSELKRTFNIENVFSVSLIGMYHLSVKDIHFMRPIILTACHYVRPNSKEVNRGLFQMLLIDEGKLHHKMRN
jgi:hypothetical protein